MRKHNPRQLRIWIPDPRSLDDLGTVGDMSMSKLHGIWRSLWYLIFLAVLALATVLFTLQWTPRGFLEKSGWNGASKLLASDHDGGNTDRVNATVQAEDAQNSPASIHPIESLMNLAKRDFERLLQRESKTFKQAAKAYRSKHGRHPPPGFDAWYAYAAGRGTLIIEEFWDQIYDDLAPFWSIQPLLLRKTAHVFSNKISIREGRIDSKSFSAYPKLQIWKDMLETLVSEPHVVLPDMDIPFNVDDEPAMLVPWEVVDTSLSLSRKIMLPAEEMVRDFTPIDHDTNFTANFEFDPEWLGPRLTHPESHHGPRPIWSIVRPACPPCSPSRLEHVFNDIWHEDEGASSEAHSPLSLLSNDLPLGSLRGYVKDWKSAIDACQQPHLQGLHSAFVAPKQMSVTKKLFPLFGDSKFAMSNEILLPGTKEWNASYNEEDASTTLDWSERQNMLFWRVPPTESHDSEQYWRRFQRERSVSMMNATEVDIAIASINTTSNSAFGTGPAKNFKLPSGNPYQLESHSQGQLATWLANWANASMVNNTCDDTSCQHLHKYFTFSDRIVANEKSTYKYAITIDAEGGDDAGELIEHLRNGHVTLRASVYHKWYDRRLSPWLHFVPVDNSFIDLYAVMEYFLGSEVKKGEEEELSSVQVEEEDSDDERHHSAPSDHNPAGVDDETHEDDAPSLTNAPHLSNTSDRILDEIPDGNEPHDFAYEPAKSPFHPRGTDAHDAAAQLISDAARAWSNRVLRREDILVYVYRLLLEYARLLDDKRDRLGWVGDLIDE